MTEDIQTMATNRRTFLRFWLPILIVDITLLAMALIWFLPSEDFERIFRVVGVELTGTLGAILLFLWFLLFSGRSLRSRGIALVAGLLVVGLGFVFVERIEFTGDIEPIFHWRFAKKNDDILEAHRQEKKTADATPSSQTAIEGTFPAFRGAARDGVVSGPPLARNWESSPPQAVWRQPVGGGYASITIENNRAYTIEQRRDKEAVVCYDAATGRERWVAEYPALFTEAMGGPGPRATPTLYEGKVYSLGATGVLLCLEAESGKEVWRVNILDENHDPNITWGMSGSPLVYDQFVVVNPGAQKPEAEGKAVVAYDRLTGKEVWSAGKTRAGYSSPMLAKLAGKRQILVFDGEGIGGYDATSGNELWRHPWTTQEGINVAQPLALEGDRVFITSGYGVGCAMLQLEEKEGKIAARELWRNKSLRCRFSSPVAHNGHIYGLDEGILVCVDEKTGERRWKNGRYRHGQILLSGDLIVVLGEQGELALVKADPSSFQELGTFQALDGKTWNYLAIAGGLAFVRNHQQMACYDLREKK
ncbi:MAG: PQQ-binding-like beta-propeller repeat protein [Planctomycetota bacterium]